VKEKALSFCIIPEMKDMVTGKLFDDICESFVTGAQFFCQVMYLHFAKPSIVKERLPRVIENIKTLGVKELVCVHDECYGSFASLGPAYGIEIPFTPIHYLEYLYGKLKDLKAHIRPINVKVAFQRPCSSRLSPDKYRFVGEIFDLIGAQLVEREYQGEKALCCGPMYRMNDPGLELCDDVQKRNVDDMVASGAEYAVFNCPACMMFLSEKVAKKGLKPVHIIELCRMALGEKQLMEGE
jgi:Fe-S oxidoreductase